MNTNKVKVINKKLIIILFALLAGSIIIFRIKNTHKELEEPIVYGDIDFDAETVQPKKPYSETHIDTVGNTYLNLINKGLFCETGKYYFFVVKYDMETYLMRMDKDSEDIVKIFQGDIRNIFIFNEWIYGIVNEGLSEYMIAMDIDGNNQYISSKYINNIRSMQSNGDKIYFTVDQRNVTGMTLCTSICQCNMDLSEEEPIKTVNNELSQVDVIAIKDNHIFFNETYGNAKEKEPFIPLGKEALEYPILYNGETIVFNSSVCTMITGEKSDFICANTYKNCAYISASGKNKNYLITYNMDTKESSFEEYSEKITQIYEYSEGIVLYSGGKYERMRK